MFGNGGKSKKCTPMPEFRFMLARGTAKSWEPLGISTQSLALHHCAGGLMSHEFGSGVPWEDLYADDLVIIVTV